MGGRIMEEYGTITISTEEYKALIATKIQHEMLMNALFGSASLNWKKNGLKYDEDILNPVISAMDYDDYISCLSAMKEKEAEDGNV